MLYFTMWNVAKLYFDITNKNYLSWVLVVETHLQSNGLGEVIKANNSAYKSKVCFLFATTCTKILLGLVPHGKLVLREHNI